MTSSGGGMFSRLRRNAAAPPDRGEDPIRAFGEWAMQRAEGICWITAEGCLDEAFRALAADLPELSRSGVRWSGAGVLHDSAVEWFAFEGGGRAVLLFALGHDRLRAPRQLAVLRALSDHGAYVIAGGSVPARLTKELRGTAGVPVWQVAGLARLAPNAVLEPAEHAVEPAHATLAA